MGEVWGRRKACQAYSLLRSAKGARLHSAAVEVDGQNSEPGPPDASEEGEGVAGAGGEGLIGATLEGLRRAAIEVEQITSAAETLQRALLPADLAAVPGISVSGRYLAAGEESQVGGDWYDVVALRDGKAGLVIGDVVGHGMHAASRMARLQSAVRAFALEGLRPGLVLERTSWFALEDDRPTMATMLYAVLDPDAGMLRAASAAHPPPLVIDRLGDARFAEGPRGSPLGARQYPSYEESMVALEPGSMIVLYTDGLVERPGVSLDDGLTRLREIAAAAPNEPGPLCDELVEGALAGERPSDDVAVLVARVDVPLAERLELSVEANPESLSRVRRTFGRWLRGIGVEGVDAYELVVACGEACANAVAHAYPVGRAHFEVSAAREGDVVEVTVRDFGSWREPSSAHSRGLRLIEQLVDELEVDRSTEGTAVIFRRRTGTRA
jgi:serine phosphatase RsbU (regulator of sigma subunit)/anti-sigma regulatory factor (Ser/Thr protein kinase)